jgi:hypothetical protein
MLTRGVSLANEFQILRRYTMTVILDDARISLEVDGDFDVGSSCVEGILEEFRYTGSEGGDVYRRAELGDCEWTETLDWRDAEITAVMASRHSIGFGDGVLVLRILL